MTVRVLFVPGADDDHYRWLAIGDGAIVARGEGMPSADETPSVAILPAQDVTLHWAALPDRSAAQSVAAAKLLVADASATPLSELHVAVGREAGIEDRPIGVVSSARMQRWLADMQHAGFDPDAMIPAPMLLPRPDEGFISANLGDDVVVRGTNTGFAHEAGLTELVTGGATPTAMARDAIEAAIVAAVAAPPLNLRQGIFAKRTRKGIDWALVRRLGWLAATISVVTLCISLVQVAKYSLAADELERRTDLLARQGLARGETVNDAVNQLGARLVRMRGAGAGFSATAAAAFAAIRGVPGTEVRGMTFDAKGELQVTLVTQTQGQILDVIRQIQAQGFAATPSPFEQNGNRLTGRITVAPR